MIGTISIEDVVKGVVVNGDNVVDYDGIAKIIIPAPPEVPVKDVKVDGESVVDPQGDANIVIPVKDVKVDGESVIDSEGIANITIPDPPEAPVKDVKVDGESVVNAQGVANITLPDPPEVPVKDVKVNGESVVNAQGVANIVVPVISNLRVVKQLPGVPAAVVTVSDAEAFTMSSLTVGVEPVQEGSGDPSPTNIRPISGWDEVDVTVADDVETPTVSNVYTIDLGGTRYGGKLDVVSGVLTVDRVEKPMPANWTINTESSIYWLITHTTSDAISVENSDTSIRIISDGFKGVTANDILTQITTPNYVNCIAIISSKRLFMKVTKADYPTLNDLYSMIRTNNLRLVYELATPLTIQLTPTAVKSLAGVNNIFADSGNVLQGEYASNIKVVDIG